MQQVVLASDWPDYTKIHTLPRGNWATLTECPGSALWIREKGSKDEHRLFVGAPFPLDPELQYEIRAAHSRLEMFAAAAAAGSQIERRSLTIRVAVTTGNRPMPFGVMRGQIRHFGNTQSISSSILRVCTLGLVDVHFRIRNATGSETATFSPLPKDFEAATGGSDGLEGNPFVSVPCAANAGLDLAMALDHTPIHSGTTNQRENLGDDFDMFVTSTFATAGTNFRISWIGRLGPR